MTDTLLPKATTQIHSKPVYLNQVTNQKILRVKNYLEYHGMNWPEKHEHQVEKNY